MLTVASVHLKCVLFRTYCLCFYDLALWKQYSITIFNKFTACYNKCVVKKFFGYRRIDSMTEIFLDLSLPTANTILHNSRLLFTEHCIKSNNDSVTFQNRVGV